MPCFAFDLPDGFIYGVPASDNVGLKIGRHVPGEIVVNPSELRRELMPEDLQAIECVRGHCFDGLSEAPIEHAACMYTMTPDQDFIVDVHPRYPQVAFAAGFSGHGFKFAPVIGEVLADLVLENSTGEPVDFLRIRWP
jgi:glycine/D-amino acid oxidase-like deaminating enzyme